MFAVVDVETTGVCPAKHDRVIELAMKWRINGDQVSRGLVERIATSRGMVVRRGVVKGLDYLVTADPDSLSGKARKAREYDVRILSEPAFWGMLGISEYSCVSLDTEV